ncbi:MAG TPA: insulinase family protein, partial [Candidatus Omnitrophica bacterium]|nr:insulinase family protein [Candidatus Omnitrophota bacterium]
FKGTKKYPQCAIEEILNRYGGKIEGFTSFDYTGYRITILKEHADTALDILKEMLTAPVFDPGELAKEKRVIKREMDLSRDDPGRRVSFLTFSNAYLVHPYRIPIIGYKENFERLKRKDLVDFFNSNYTPERMVLAAVGDIDSAEIFEKIKALFDAVPRGNNSAPVLPPEPGRVTENYAEEKLGIEGAYLNIAFHSSAITDRDVYALDLLSFILGQGESSILNKKIRMEKQIVLSVSAYNYTPRYPGLFIISGVLKEEKVKEALDEILKEIDLVKKTGVTGDDLSKAKNNFLAGYIYRKETVESQANDMAIGELLTGNPDFFGIYMRRVKSLTAEDIKTAANKFLNTEGMTVAVLSRSGRALESESAVVSRSSERDIKKLTLRNDLPVLISEDHSLPIVSIAVLFKGGVLLENRQNNGISRIAGLMLMNGTDEMSREEIAEVYESKGISIEPYSGNNSMGMTIKCLKEQTETAFNLVSGLYMRSVFPEAELEREKKEINSAIDMQDNRIFNQGHRLLKEQLFSEHPYRFQAIGTHESVSAITREDVMDFHGSLLTADNMVLGVCGDCETGEIKSLAEKYFSQIPLKRTVLDFPAEEPALSGMTEKLVKSPKEQSLVLYGFRGVDVYDSDRYAAEVMLDMLSMGSGVFFKKIREREGLAYATGAFQVMGLDPGYLVIYTLTSKENINRVKDIISGEIRLFAKNGCSREDLEKTKNHLKAMRQIDTQTNSSFIFASSMDELYGLGYNNYKDYEKNIESVTVEDVKNISKRLLDLNKCAVVIIEGQGGS